MRAERPGPFPPLFAQVSWPCDSSWSGGKRTTLSQLPPGVFPGKKGTWHHPSPRWSTEREQRCLSYRNRFLALLRGMGKETSRVRELYRNPRKRRIEEGKTDVSGRLFISIFLIIFKKIIHLPWGGLLLGPGYLEINYCQGAHSVASTRLGLASVIEKHSARGCPARSHSSWFEDQALWRGPS